MELIRASYLMDKCDYSFSAICVASHVPLKVANYTNQEFLNACEKVKKKSNVMTLFIDNIRLYRRDPDKIVYTNMEREGTNNWENHRIARDQLLKKYSNEDLLELCSKITDLNFIIFTGLEDLNIDDNIFDRIPDNVLGIYAASCSESFGGKVHPFPFGLPYNPNGDFRNELIEKIATNNADYFFEREIITPKNLLYINHSVGSNPERPPINNHFKNINWCRVDGPVSVALHDYEDYLNKIKSHKFVISADGNAINCDCYRVWETLYMRRVPVLKRSKNFEYLFKDLPVLFVDDFLEITEDLLIENEHLYQRALEMDMNLLDISVMYNNIIKSYSHLSISKWIKDYASKNNFSLVVGISGGIDSALVSTLSALTGLDTHVVSMPIHQNKQQLERARKHIEWLKSNFKNVRDYEFDLSDVFDKFSDKFTSEKCGHCGSPLFSSNLSLANSRSRLRMMSLYQVASNVNGIVVGTGNKIEDFGVGFFTKYGDGGVDISPIADLTKSEVRQMAKTIGIINDIIVAKPTDGLWDDDRSDEDQIGATYEELEWAMIFSDHIDEIQFPEEKELKISELSSREKEVYNIYKKFNTMNKHKMVPIPVYKKNDI